MAASKSPGRLVRLPADLLAMLRVLAVVSGESMGEVIDRHARGGIEAEFAKLPKDVQKLARKGQKQPAG